MIFSEEQLKVYAAPLSETEDQKCQNAIHMVSDALKDIGFSGGDGPLTRMVEDTYAYSIEMRNEVNNRKVKIFIQGSYANNTNVRTQSDVDIAVVEEDIFTDVYRKGVTRENYGFVAAQERNTTFKNEVQDALIAKFKEDVERKNKSIKIHGNTYRKDADAVPCRRYRDYQGDYLYKPDNYIGGILIKADDGSSIINYPEQHIANGKKKNNETNYSYKKMVRIMKKMRYLMEESGYSSASGVSSFMLESLLWNLPNSVFTKWSYTYKFIFEDILNYAFNNKSQFSYYKEANGIKALCPSQVDTAKLCAYIDNLYGFYKYE